MERPSRRHAKLLYLDTADIGDPRCWYCGEPAALWCDAVVGFVDEQRRPEQQLLFGEPPAHRRPKVQSRPDTCDAAACRPCARVHGWRRDSAHIVCSRGRGRCRADSTDFCHQHAAGPAPLGFAADQLVKERARLRDACRELEANRRRQRLSDGTGT